jgi:F-type H+-transporting ATPase subunit a
VSFTTADSSKYSQVVSDSGNVVAHSGKQTAEKDNLFTELLHHTQDSHEIELPGFHVDLPYIFVENGKINFHASKESLREAGYTVRHEKVVRMADGDKPQFDMSITKHVVFLWGAALIVILFAIAAARGNRKNKVPTGLGNLIEVFVVFVRDEIVLANMGKAGLRYLPYLLTTFFFVLIMNLFGLIPYGATATGNVSVTAGLAAISFIMIQVSAIRAQGLGQYFMHLTGGVHWSLWLLMVPIEILGLFTKPFALCIRLFANMTGGHIVIVSLFGLIFLFKSYFIAPASIAFVLGINLLELFVAVLQAYIFTMLTSLFMGLGIQAGHHEHEEHTS